MIMVISMDSPRPARRVFSVPILLLLCELCCAFVIIRYDPLHAQANQATCDKQAAGLWADIHPVLVRSHASDESLLQLMSNTRRT